MSTSEWARTLSLSVTPTGRPTAALSLPRPLLAQAGQGLPAQSTWWGGGCQGCASPGGEADPVSSRRHPGPTTPSSHRGPHFGPCEALEGDRGVPTTARLAERATSQGAGSTGFPHSSVPALAPRPCPTLARWRPGHPECGCGFRPPGPWIPVSVGEGGGRLSALWSLPTPGNWARPGLASQATGEARRGAGWNLTPRLPQALNPSSQGLAFQPHFSPHHPPPSHTPHPARHR